MPLSKILSITKDYYSFRVCGNFKKNSFYNKGLKIYTPSEHEKAEFTDDPS